MSARGRVRRDVFAAALDAKAGKAWVRATMTEVPDAWWSTQGRHLRLAARLVGVAIDLPERIRLSIATLLSVGMLSLRDLCQAKGYRARGAGICSVLEQMKGHAFARAEQLLVCGHLTGQWGEPLHWDVRRRVLVRSPFCIPGTGPPT